MTTEIIATATTRVAQAFQENPKLRPWFLLYPVGIIIIAIFASLLGLKRIPEEIANIVIGLSVGALAIFSIAVSAYQDAKITRTRSAKLESIEQEVRTNPEKTKAAWDLAQEKLESYLDRNLSQVRSIYWLCLLIMIFGFVLVGYGAFLIYNNEAHMNASILSAISGIIISFLDGSFILVYRSTLGQAKEYVSMLERINAVGMSLQILDSLSDSTSELKDKSKAEIAKELLTIYSISAKAK
jgi:hypothetical protein